MKLEYARQIAELLNSRNQLTRTYDVNRIIQNTESFIYELKDEVVIACIEAKKVQWYQWEVCHLTVDPNYEGQGYGSKMIQKAEEKAKQGKAKIIQCTIRVDNEASKRTFERNSYKQVSSFFNPASGNDVTVWQKAISYSSQNEVATTNSLHLANEQLKTDIDKLKEKKYALECEIKEQYELEAENFGLNGEISELEATVESLESQVEHLEIEIDCLREELFVAQGNEIDLEGEVEVLRNENEVLNEELLYLQSEQPKDIGGIYIGSRRRQHFHKPNCEWVEYIPFGLRIEFSSHQEAVDAGRKPCKTCKA